MKQKWIQTFEIIFIFWDLKKKKKKKKKINDNFLKCFPENISIGFKKHPVIFKYFPFKIF